MKHYSTHGQKGMQQVREIVETTQDTAHQMTIEGRRLFDSRSQATKEFKNRIWAKLKKSNSYDPTDLNQATLSAQISGATVRQATHLPNNDLLTSLALARTTLDPTNPLEVVSDQAALYQLHDLAIELNWEERELETLFEATREGQAVALGGKQTAINAVARRMTMHGEFGHLDKRTRQEAARLALLITKRPTTRKTNTMPLPTAPMRTAPLPTKPLPTQPISPSGTSATGPTVPHPSGADQAARGGQPYPSHRGARWPI